MLSDRLNSILGGPGERAQRKAAKAQKRAKRAQRFKGASKWVLGNVVPVVQGLAAEGAEILQVKKTYDDFLAGASKWGPGLTKRLKALEGYDAAFGDAERVKTGFYGDVVDVYRESLDPQNRRIVCEGEIINLKQGTRVPYAYAKDVVQGGE
jgi:hypothetical protein